LDLSRHQLALTAGVKDHVDPTPSWVSDSNFRIPVPTRVGECQECFQDSCLVPVANRRSRVRIDPRREVRAECQRELRVRVDRGALPTILDPAQVGKVDSGFGRKKGAGCARVLTESADVIAKQSMNAIGLASRFGRASC